MASCTQVLCVAATDHSDNLASFSNYATKYVPRGVQALTCIPTTLAWIGLLALIWLSQSLGDIIKFFSSHSWPLATECYVYEQVEIAAPGVDIYSTWTGWPT